MAWIVSTPQLLALVSLTAMSIDVIRRLILDRIERNGYPLPPGPTSFPLLGSVLSVDFGEPFRSYTEWRAKYGDIVYTRLLGMDVVVLNSVSVARELLDKRSQIYSNRPFIATVTPYGHDFDFAFAQYGDDWRLCRRIFHQTFGADTVVRFRPMQLRKAHQLILNLMDDPGNCFSHYSTFAAAVTLCSVYDYDPKPKDDEIVSIIDKFIRISIPALMPEKAVLLQVFPFLLHMPDWLPGSAIKHEARVAREHSARVIEMPYQYARKRIESKEGNNPSMVSENITRMEKFDYAYRSEYEKVLKDASSTAFLGAVETTSSALETFLLAMVKNPDVWKRAQAEIDAIVGTDRLPVFDDRSSLPYVDAILRETLRWQPPAPLGAPHATTTNDIYNGFYIPKGATVLANVWAMSRDETRYPNAKKFMPERFLDADGMLIDETPDFTFGFGRRACPGRHAADASMWCAMVMMLATLDFNLANDANGKDIQFEVKYISSMARHPLTFPCHVTPRKHINRASLEWLLAQ